MVRSGVLRVMLLIGAIALLSSAGRGDQARPEGRGLAATYHGDKGIARDPAVIFADGFESDTRVWDGDTPHPTRTREKAGVHAGAYAHEIETRPGQIGGGLVKWFDPGYERVYARWYAKFDKGFDQGPRGHIGASLGGYADHALLGTSGRKPNGDDFFSAALEVWNWHNLPPPGELAMYCYHLDLLPDTPTETWGRSYVPAVRFTPEAGRWYCFEIMLKANHPGQADGEQAFWVDGKLLAHAEGIHWRSAADLKINGFWLYAFLRGASQVNRVWYDDVVIANAYIGPMGR
jgi:hypothetical protein